VPRLRPRPRKNDLPLPQLEGAICVEEFRPGVVAPLIRRGQQLPPDHPIVQAHPGFFRGLVRLEEEVTEDAKDG
jgi:hypothetical protein